MDQDKAPPKNFGIDWAHFWFQQVHILLGEIQIQHCKSCNLERI